MKKQLQHLPTVALFFMAMCLLISVSFAQAPNGFNYQAAIRNADGSIKSNESVSLEFSILNGSASGAVLYKETQLKTTSEYGMINHVIGSGVRVSGSFTTINWGVGSKFLKIDLNTGSSLVTISNQMLQSVPYALFANETAAGSGQWNTNGNNIYNKNSGRVGIGTNNPFSLLHLTNSGTNNYIRLNAGDAVSRYAGIKLLKENLDNGWIMQMDAGSDNLTFQHQSGATSIADRVTFKSDGNVGIGINTPTAPLSFANGVANKKISLYDVLSNDHQFVGLGTDGGVFRYQVDGVTASHVFYSAANANASNELMRIRGDGNVGIGTANPATKLHINHSNGVDGLRISNSSGGADYWDIFTTTANDLHLYSNNNLRGRFNSTSGSYTSLSDSSLKENIKPFETTLKKLMLLEVKRYNFKNDEQKTSQIGVLAQDANLLFPELVEFTQDRNQDVYLLNYAGFSMVAIKAIQEQQVLIENLSRDKESLEDRILKLEQAILEMNERSK